MIWKVIIVASALVMVATGHFFSGVVFLTLGWLFSPYDDHDRDNKK